MYKKLKDKLSVKAKRTKQQVDQEYQYHALNIGHKDRLITQLEAEIEDHRFNMRALYKEGLSLPTNEPKPQNVAMTEGTAP